MDDQLLDDTYQQTHDGTVKNGLTIRRLSREHTQGRLRCVASNNNITMPAESSLRLKMLCKYRKLLNRYEYRLCCFLFVILALQRLKRNWL